MKPRPLTCALLLTCPLLIIAGALLLPRSAQAAELQALEQQVAPNSRLLRDFYLQDDFRREARELLAHYRQTQDARYATPQHGMTMLHLAAICLQPQLAQELLAAGADPNALMKRFHSYGFEPSPDTPLSAALQYRALPAQESKAPFLQLARLLQHSGAQLNHEATENLISLVHARFDENVNGKRLCDGEDIVLALMDMGTHASMYQAENMVEAGYLRALTRMLAEMPPQEMARLQRYGQILHECAMPYYRPYSRPDERECSLLMARELLKGVDIRQRPFRHAQETFERVAEHMPEWTPEAKSSIAILTERAEEDPLAHVDDFLALFLQHGADPLRPCGPHRKSCAADYIAADAELCRRLRERHGLSIEPPAHQLEETCLMEQLADIPTAAFRPQEITAAWNMLVRLLAAPEAKQLANTEQHLQTSFKALQLLRRADRRSTRMELLATPTLRGGFGWEGNKLKTSRHLLHNLLALRQSVLDATSIEQSAHRLLQDDRPDVAHAILGLLEYDPDPTPFLQRLTQEGEPPALRAAALSCQLRRAGLPDLDKLAREWAERTLVPYKAPVKLALAALAPLRLPHSDSPDLADLAPERLLYTGKAKLRRPVSKESLQALRQLGAPLAAQYCQSGKGDPIAASFQLEIAIALHILAHEEDFRHPYLPHNCPCRNTR